MLGNFKKVLTLLIVLMVSYVNLYLLSTKLFAEEINTAYDKRFVLVIESVIRGSVAEKAGLEVNDIIYSLNGRIFYDQSANSIGNEFVEYINTLPAGEYKIVVLRKGEKVEISLPLLSTSSSPRLGISIKVLENEPQIYFDKAVDMLSKVTKREDLKTAANLFENAKILSSKWYDVYYNLGLVYEELGYYDKAVENFKEYLIHAPKESPRIEEATKAVDRNEKMHKKIENIKFKMVNSEWILIKKFPPVKIAPSFYPKFKLDSSGKMWMANPLTDLENTILMEWRRNLKEHPWFPVEFDGRFFEVKCVNFYTGERLVSGIWQIYYYPQLYMFKGEINLDSSESIIIIREFIRMGDDMYISFDEANKSVFPILKDFKFDETKDFRYELHYRLK
ncbi:PDZ domain-containing protein [Sulfurihydrogenibium azorense]|uniref:tetratricopeptide repeat protein n=1 Tax=Sulfurihydrogenibium azorense TaxID=309806 RepID=UPI00391C0C6F